MVELKIELIALIDVVELAVLLSFVLVYRNMEEYHHSSMMACS